MGYFHLALAAALEDRANPEALYVVYMKLAEIHGNHMPDAQLCQLYRDRANSLKKVLSGAEDSAVNEEIGKDTSEHCDSDPFPRTSGMQADTHRDAERLNEVNERQDDDIPPRDTNKEFGNTTAFISSQSYSESILTESFDTAREYMSDSCSSTDTVQTSPKQIDGNDLTSNTSLDPDKELVMDPHLHQNDPSDNLSS